MDSTVITKKRADLKKAMEDLCEKAGEDKKLCDAIKDRGFWARLFANNTRDLARAGMSQMGLIEGLQHALQGMMEIFKDATERERQIAAVIDEMRKSEDSSLSTLREAVGKSIKAALKQACEMTRLNSRVDVGGSIDASKTAASKCASEMSDYCTRTTSVSGEEFCQSLERIAKACFLDKNVPLRNEDKVYIVDRLSQVAPAGLDYDQGFGQEHVATSLLVENVLERLSPEGDRYARFRNELVGIIDEFVSHKDMVDPDGKSIAQLTAVKNRLFESQFEIALIGEFQGGKSTTFNALCGGREISPRGLGTGGVKTSAAVITAQNIAGNETRNGLSEWAEIKWLDKLELRKRIAYALGVECGNSIPDNDKLSHALRVAWDKLTPDSDDERDMLQIATLQLRLLSSDTYEEFSGRTIVAIDEFQRYVQFPKSWEMRWAEKKMDADFSIEECLFAALDSVLVRIHSKYLERLGCRVTDCPGLFVSKWDTDRALTVMSRSNAVWYLLNGNKEMAKEQKKVLQSIRQGGWHSKCFFTLNVKGDEASTEGILRANAAKIKNAGFNVEGRVFKYNAAVAFRLAQLDFANERGLGTRDIDCLAVESANKRNKYEDVLTRLASASTTEHIEAIREQIYTVLLMARNYDPSLRTLNEDELKAELENFAGLKSIVRSLERHVISRGAAEILLGNKGCVDERGSLCHCGSGVKLCRQVLEILRGDKKAEEASARMDFEQAKRQWEEDERNFIKFDRAVKKEFLFLQDNTQLDEQFLDDFYNWAWKSVREEVQEAAIDITLEEWRDGHWTNTGVKEAATTRIKEEFSRIFKLKLDAYGKQITETTLYQKEIGGRIKSSWDELKEEWAEMEHQNPHFEGLCPDAELVAVEINPFNDSIDQGIEVPSYFFEFFRDIGNRIASWFGADRETSEDRIRRFFREQDPIAKALETLRDSYYKSVKFKELFAQARLQNKAKIELSMAAARRTFEERINKDKALMTSSDNVRQQKANEARRVREEIIEPRITVLEGFEARVKASYGC